MKILEVVTPAEFEDQPGFAAPKDNLEPKDDWKNYFSARKIKKEAIEHHDLVLMRQLEKLMEKYPNDIFFQSFPSENDRAPSGVFLNARIEHPDLDDHPEDFVIVNSPGVWFDEDLSENPDYGHEDAHEEYYVRKSSPYVKTVASIIAQHQVVRKQLRKLGFA